MIWLIPAGAAAVIGVLFAAFFNPKRAVAGAGATGEP